ncbi:hypothetical protein GCM10020227_42700 [Streptomyces flavovirens]
MPLTRPRRATNQRWVTVAEKAIAMEPVPRPTSRPQYSISCQAAVIQTPASAPAATALSATTTTRRMPKRSINAAANGAVSPYRAMSMETASPISPRDQPNSVWRGSMSRPGRELKAAPPMIVTKVTAATIHARCIRGREGLRGGAARGVALSVVGFTWTSIRAAATPHEWLECHPSQGSGHGQRRTGGAPGGQAGVEGPGQGRAHRVPEQIRCVERRAEHQPGRRAVPGQFGGQVRQLGQLHRPADGQCGTGGRERTHPGHQEDHEGVDQYGVQGVPRVLRRRAVPHRADAQPRRDRERGGGHRRGADGDGGGNG